MRDYITIGSVPAGEMCVQVGDPDYAKKSFKESARFIKQLKDQFGEPPTNAELKLKAFDHDFGVYHEVVCWFDDEDEEAENYCFMIEADMPEFWND